MSKREAKQNNPVVKKQRVEKLKYDDLVLTKDAKHLVILNCKEDIPLPKQYAFIFDQVNSRAIISLKENQNLEECLPSLQRLVLKRQSNEFVSCVYESIGKGNSVIINNRLVVAFKEKLDFFEREAFLYFHGLTEISDIEPLPNTFHCQLLDNCADTPLAIVNRLLNSPSILTVQPDLISL